MRGHTVRLVFIDGTCNELTVGSVVAFPWEQDDLSVNMAPCVNLGQLERDRHRTRCGDSRGAKFGYANVSPPLCLEED
jgi:hypothetical protein